MEPNRSCQLSVTGDSMIEEGILQGDIVIVRPEKDPVNVCISIVLIHDAVTLKFFSNRGRLSGWSLQTGF